MRHAELVHCNTIAHLSYLGFSFQQELVRRVQMGLHKTREGLDYISHLHKTGLTVRKEASVKDRVHEQDSKN